MEFTEEDPRPVTDEASSGDPYANVSDDDLFKAIESGVDPLAEQEERDEQEVEPEQSETVEAQAEDSVTPEEEPQEEAAAEPEEDPRLAELQEELERRDLELQKVRFQHDKLAGQFGAFKSQVQQRQQSDDLDYAPQDHQPQVQAPQSSNPLHDPAYRQDFAVRVAERELGQRSLSPEVLQHYQNAIQRVGGSYAEQIHNAESFGELESQVKLLVGEAVLDARKLAREASKADVKERGAKRAQQTIAKKKAASVSSRQAPKPSVESGPKAPEDMTDAELDAAIARLGGSIQLGG